MALMPPNQHSRTDGTMPNATELPAINHAPRARDRAGTPRGSSSAHRNTARGTVSSVRKGTGMTSVPGHQLAVRALSQINLIAEFTLFTLGELASAAVRE